MLEYEMATDGFSFLKKQEKYKIAKQEVPFLSRCIDVVLMNRNDEVISIEFKISKWRHAIEQAKNHKLGADKAYICLPERQMSKALYLAIQEAGIGLLLYDPERKDRIHEVIPAPDQNSNIPVFRTMLLSNLDKV